jgi:ABC-2 type transport system ATP-binding protein
MNPIIETERLTKTFDTTVAVERLDLEVHKGDVFGFLGPNGSGKTTTIRMLLGLIRPTAGRARIFGYDVATETRRILPRVGAIIETPVFYPYLSGLDNLRAMAIASGMQKATARRRIAETIELVGLEGRERDRYRQYSLGMKQRLGIAAALLNEPDLVLLDEPTNGLDPAGIQEMRELIRSLAASGRTVFVSSHVLHEVEQMCTHVGIMKRGQMVHSGRVSDLLAERGCVVIRLSSPDEALRAVSILSHARDTGASWLGSVEMENRAGSCCIEIDTVAARSVDLNRMLGVQGIYAAEIRCERADLEDLFMTMTTDVELLPPQKEVA